MVRLDRLPLHAVPDRRAVGLTGPHAPHNLPDIPYVSALGWANRKHWVRTGAEGAAGTIYVTYRNSVDVRHISLGINDVSRGPGGWHAAYTAKV